MKITLIEGEAEPLKDLGVIENLLKDLSIPTIGPPMLSNNLTASTLFSLNIHLTATFLDGITLYEKIDCDELTAFQGSSYTSDYSNWKTDRAWENERTHLAKYKEQYNKKLDLIAVKYTRGRRKMGRPTVIKSLGMFSIARKTRNTLMRRNYYDIDIENAHPKMLQSLLENNGYKTAIKYPMLYEYATNREEVLTRIMTAYNCSRRRAKNAFISLMYGGTVESWKTGKRGDDGEADDEPVWTNDLALEAEYLDDYQKDMNVIMDLFISLNTDLFKKHSDAYRNEPKNANKKNERGSFFSNILQDYETKIVSHILSWIMYETPLTVQGGNHILTYSADGFMLLNERVDAYGGGLHALLEDITQKVFDYSGMELKWLAKDINADDEYHIGFEYIPLPIEAIEVIESEAQQNRREKADKKEQEDIAKKERKEKTVKDYATKKKHFEERCFKIVSSGMYIEIDKHTGDASLYKRQQFVDKFLHLSLGVDCFGEQISFIDKWIHDPNILKYYNIDIYPNVAECPTDCFNMWKPFPMEAITEYIPNEEGKDFILNHIFILCGNDLVAYRQFIKWFAHMIQFPHKKSICPTLISKMGAGKTTIYLIMKKMFGDEKCFETCDPALHIWGTFNSVLQNKMLIYIDDPDIDACGRGFDEKMKNFITSDIMTLHKKGCDAMIMKCFYRVFITTNRQNGVLKEEKGGRRNLVMRSSDELIGDKAYFKVCYGYIEDMNIMKTLYEYLKNMKGIKAILDEPIMTTYQTSLTNLSVKPLELWVKDMVGTEAYERRQKVLNGEIIPEGDNIVIMNTTEILKKYATFCTDSHFKYNSMNAISIGVSLHNLMYDDDITTKHTNMGNKKVFNITKLEVRLGIDKLPNDEDYESVDEEGG